MSNAQHLDLLGRLCRIDSRTGHGDGVRAVSSQLADILLALGFTCRWEAHETLIAEYGQGQQPHLILLGHADTVLGPDDVPFRVDGGRALGAGVSDMKGGLVVMMAALQKSSTWRQARVTVIINGSEEAATHEFPPLARKLCQGADALVNVEPGYLRDDKSWSIVRARKGVARYRLTVHGKAAHAGNRHEQGASAMRELARKIEQVESLTDYSQQLTANVGVVHSGRAYNMVPDLATAEFELRALEPDVMIGAQQELALICQKPTVTSHDGLFACRIELESLPGFPPFPVNEGTDALVAAYSSLAPVEVAGIVRGGASDANHVVDLVPCLDGVGVLGDGFHSTQEWMDLGSFGSRIETMIALLKNLAVSR